MLVAIGSVAPDRVGKAASPGLPTAWPPAHAPPDHRGASRLAATIAFHHPVHAADHLVHAAEWDLPRADVRSDASGGPRG
jgi:hypothetical protein